MKYKVRWVTEISRRKVSGDFFMDMHMIEALPTQFRAAPAQEGIFAYAGVTRPIKPGLLELHSLVHHAS